MPEIALNGTKKDEERDLILLLLMQVIKNQGSLYVETFYSDKILEKYHVKYELNDNNSMMLTLEEN
jgi:hypothetical protein